VQPLHPPDAAMLSYRLPDFNLELAFHPTEFTQVNPAVNRMLVRRAMALACNRRQASALPTCFAAGQLQPADRAPWARKCSGIEGSAALVASVPDRTRSAMAWRAAANLPWPTCSRRRRKVCRAWALDKLLIDPPREGAIAVVKALPWSAGRSASSMFHAARQPWPVMRRCWCMRRAIQTLRRRYRQHVPAHLASRIDRAVREMSGQTKRRPRSPFYVAPFRQRPPVSRVRR
jgi:hypothetical protein